MPWLVYDRTLTKKLRLTASEFELAHQVRVATLQAEVKIF